MNYKTWLRITAVTLLTVLAIFAAVVIVVDPMFHYHAPLSALSYELSDERYQNDGILKFFDYNGVIIGTSMCENFMTSQADELFSLDFIKTPFSGARYKEINDNIAAAYESGHSPAVVIRSLDMKLLILDKDAYWEDVTYPEYLYNDNIFDDVNYIFNKEALLRSFKNILLTLRGGKSTTFDEYANWNDEHIYGPDAVLNTYTLGEKAPAALPFTDEDREMVLENIRQNVTELINSHQETEFYLFFPPYSVFYWDELQWNGELDRMIDAMELAASEILTCPNARLFGFSDEFSITSNTDIYLDQTHFDQTVNALMLDCMARDEHRLDSENLGGFICAMREYYSSFNYASLHKGD